MFYFDLTPGVNTDYRYCICTAESIDALKDPSDFLPEFASLTAHSPNDTFAPVQSSNEWPILHEYQIQPFTVGALTFGVDSWYLGGFDPFSALPEQDGEPIPKQSLICHCKNPLLILLLTQSNSIASHSTAGSLAEQLL